MTEFIDSKYIAKAMSELLGLGGIDEENIHITHTSENDKYDTVEYGQFVVPYFRILKIAGINNSSPEDDREQRFKKITGDMLEIFKSKNPDYGNSFDKSMDEFGITSAIIRMNYKLKRLKTLSKKESMVKDESVQDTLLDLANYAIMTVMYLKKYEDETDNK